MRVADAGMALMLAGAIAGAGCARNRVPREWRGPAAAAQRSARGGWITIEARPNGRRLAEGELIALDEAAFHVLSAAGLQSVPRASAHRIKLVAYGTAGGALTGWAVAGGISTLSHGRLLLITAPVWTIAGLLAVHAEKRAGIVRDDELARRFARFPQGLPPGLDPRSLGELPGRGRP